jgi:hypothetical protein
MQVHLKGLEEMVKLRGGIRDGGFAPYIRRLIAWYQFVSNSYYSFKC